MKPDPEGGILVHPALDVWSVGMTICEIVCLSQVLKPVYSRFLKDAESQREAGAFLMDWLRSIDEVPLPWQIIHFDADFHDLVVNWLLVCDKNERKSCAQCLAHTFMASKSKGVKAEDTDMSESISKGAEHAMRRNRIEDTSDKARSTRESYGS